MIGYKGTWRGVLRLLGHWTQRGRALCSARSAGCARSVWLPHARTYSFEPGRLCLSFLSAHLPALHVSLFLAAWGALLGRRLSQRGVLVFCLDYRNFPQVGWGWGLEVLRIRQCFCLCVWCQWCVLRAVQDVDWGIFCS